MRLRAWRSLGHNELPPITTHHRLAFIAGEKCIQIDNGAEFTKQFMTKEINNHSMFEVTARRLKRHQDRTNNHPMRPLNYLTPKQYLEQYENKLSKE